VLEKGGKNDIRREPILVTFQATGESLIGGGKEIIWDVMLFAVPWRNWGREKGKRNGGARAAARSLIRGGGVYRRKETRL